MALPSARLFEFIKREGVELFSGAHAVYTPQPLVEEILSQIDVKNKTILVLFNVEFVISLVHTYKVDPAMITLYVDHENKAKLAQRMGVNFITSLDVDMKFDVAVGNPPYQDGSKDGGQNKIYNVICKQTLSLLKDDSAMVLITPTSVLKTSKRFSLINQPGLKAVNFTVDEYFDVGINICSWLIDKRHSSNKVVVTNSDGTSNVQESTSPIYNFATADKNFTTLYNKLKQVTNTPEKRMFRENNFGSSVSKQPTELFTHTLYSVNRDGNKEIFGYSKRIPFFCDKKKIVIPMTKTLTNESIILDVDNFYVAYLCTEIHSTAEANNIKSFILSDYFKQHSKKWRELDGYGFNYALKYLPPFDTSKHWTDGEVKEFIESYAN